MGESPIAIEVPSFETVELYRPPVKRVEGVSGDGEPYRFASHDSAGSTLNDGLRGEAALSSLQLHNNGLFWQFDASSPTRLNIYDFSLERPLNRDASVCLEFAHPICPSIAGKTTPNGCHIYLFTADGMLHDIYKPSNTEQVVPLVQAVSIQSKALSDSLGANGSPSSLSVVGDRLCIGTSDGRVLCWPLETVALEDGWHGCTELNPHSSLLSGWLLGGLLGRGAPLQVEQIVDLSFMGRPYLCSLHAGAVLRFWDLTSHQLLHSANLLPSKAGERPAFPTRISVARIAKEPLDASRYILLICLEPSDSELPCQLRTFELYLEERGGGALKLGIEGGALLSGTIHRIVDVQIRQWTTNQAAWLLHDDSTGNRYLSCVPIAFADGEVHDAVNVMLIEDQILSSQLEKEEEILCVQHIVDALCTTPEHPDLLSYVKGLVSSVCAPGCFSRPVMDKTFKHLGWLNGTEDVPNTAVRDALVESLLSVASSTPGDHTVLGTWSRFVGVYAATYRQVCHPIALVQQVTHREEESLIVLRHGGHISLVRRAEPVEEICRGIWPAGWNSLHVSDDIAGAKLLWKAARAVVGALGNHSQTILSLVRDSVMNGTDYSAATIVPRMLCVLGGGRVGGDASQHLSLERERRIRELALTVGQLCSSGTGDAKNINIKRSLSTLLELLAQDRIVLSRRKRSSMENISRPLRAMALATAHQISAAQSEVLLSLTMVASYIISTPTLGWYSPTDDDRTETTNLLHRRAFLMLQAAIFAYWSTCSTLSHSIQVKELHNESSASNLIFSLRLRDVPDGTSTPPKHARLDDGYNAAYPAEHCFESFVKEAYVVRDVGDASAMSWLFAYWLLGIRPAQSGEGGVVMEGSAEPVALMRALQLSPHLLRTRSIVALKELVHDVLNEVERNDIRIIFYHGCAIALSGARLQSREQASRLEAEALQCFARVSASFAHRQLFATQLQAIHKGLDILGTASLRIETDPGAPENVKGAAEEVYYYEVLVGFFEKLGFLDAATKCALAAIQKLPVAADGTSDLDLSKQLVARSSHLWSAIFSYKLAESRHEDAFVCILGIEDEDIQASCLRRLVKDMVDKGNVSCLCSLPFASHTRLSLLDEALSILTDLAMSSSLTDRPQPYWVLFDFHIARGSYQSAAKALMAYVRRLERESQSRNADEIRSALSAVLAALQVSGKQSEQACWLEVPMVEAEIAEIDMVVENDGRKEPGGLLQSYSNVSQILTVTDLKRECALARARSAVMSMFPADSAPSISSPTDAAHQLLGIRLYDEAFAVVDVALVGSKQQQMRERCVEVLARHCAQIQLGFSFSGDIATGGPGPGPGTGTGDAPGGRVPLVVTDHYGGLVEKTQTDIHRGVAAKEAWLKLRSHLERYEGCRTDGSRLRIVALGAVLSTDSKLQPPPWLLEPFFQQTSRQDRQSGGPSGPQIHPDIAGLLRTYMTYGRTEEAALMALSFLDPLTNRVPSVAFPKPATVCVPHSLLRHLASSLDGDSPLRKELERKLELEETMALRQTSVLSEIYAE